jgi:protein tyrosine/serine phosphatase
VSIPWRGSKDQNPTQIAEILAMLRENADKQVFVNCQRGAERTGVMVACYRISADNWTVDQALDEMEEFGFRGLWFRHLKKFVREFPLLLLNDPLLKKLKTSSG